MDESSERPEMERIGTMHVEEQPAGAKVTESSVAPEPIQAEASDPPGPNPADSELAGVRDQVAGKDVI